MSSLCIIPARGGSKRLPRKNIREFLGQPIISYPIKQALLSGIFDEVMVSTDDEEIASIARKFKANVPFLRTHANSDDYSTIPDVIEEVLGDYDRKGMQFSHTCCLMATNPFIKAQVILDSYEKLIENNGNSLIGVVEYPHPIERSFEIENNTLSMSIPTNFSIRTQDITPRYYDAGSLCWINNESFKIFKSGFTDKTIPYIIPSFECQDIDNEFDWKLAELKFKILNSE